MRRIRVEIEMMVQEDPDTDEALAEMLAEQVGVALEWFADPDTNELPGGYTARLVQME
jgi:hypothetical protein